MGIWDCQSPCPILNLCCSPKKIPNLYWPRTFPLVISKHTTKDYHTNKIYIYIYILFTDANITTHHQINWYSKIKIKVGISYTILFSKETNLPKPAIIIMVMSHVQFALQIIWEVLLSRAAVVLTLESEYVSIWSNRTARKAWVAQKLKCTLPHTTTWFATISPTQTNFH